MSVILSAEAVRSLSFEGAIAYANDLLSHLPEDEAVQEEAIATLLATANGARGFFVAFLTGEWELADRPAMPVLRAIQRVPEPATELLVKNFAMSTAMAIAHRRTGHEDQAQGSERVARRSAAYLSHIALPAVRETAARLHASAATGGGDYADFLDRWGYDDAQRRAIAAGLQQLLGATRPSLDSGAAPS